MEEISELMWAKMGGIDVEKCEESENPTIPTSSKHRQQRQQILKQPKESETFLEFLRILRILENPLESLESLESSKSLESLESLERLTLPKYLPSTVGRLPWRPPSGGARGSRAMSPDPAPRPRSRPSGRAPRVLERGASHVGLVPTLLRLVRTVHDVFFYSLGVWGN